MQLGASKRPGRAGGEREPASSREGPALPAQTASHSRAGSLAPFPVPCAPSAYDEHREQQLSSRGRQLWVRRLLNETAFYFLKVSFQYWQVGGRETKSSVFRRPCSLTERFQVMILMSPAACFNSHQINAHKTLIFQELSCCLSDSKLQKAWFLQGLN